MEEHEGKVEFKINSTLERYSEKYSPNDGLQEFMMIPKEPKKKVKNSWVIMTAFLFSLGIFLHGTTYLAETYNVDVLCNIGEHVIFWFESDANNTFL